MSDLHNAASQLGELGYSVFPCVYHGKNPATANGFHDATCDIEQIDQFWTPNPNANIGLHTAGLILVDVDPIDGKPNPWLADHQEQLSADCGACQRTPRGGYHYFFRQPEGADYRSSGGKIAKGVDIRANGGYVVLAPSYVVDFDKGIDGPYRWIQPLDCPVESLPVAPGWLLALLDAIKTKSTSTEPVETAGGDIANGQRNSTLTSMAGNLRRVGHSFEEISPLLQAVNNRRCKPPLDYKEVDQIAYSVCRYEPDQVWQAVIEGTGDARRGPAKTSMVLTRAGDVDPQPISWLWPQRIARGKLNLIQGDPGLGKSHLTCDLAARVSRGANWPDGSEGCEAGSVIIFSAEDDLADTIRPRLDRANADVEKVFVFSSMQSVDPKTGEPTRQAFSLADHMKQLEEAIDEIGDVVLVIVDPIASYTGKVDSHKNAEVRTLLEPLASLAARKGIAIVAVTHMSKAAGGKSVYRAMGSLAFTAAARIVWMLCRDLDDPRNRLLLPVKANIAKDLKGLRFSIEGDIGGSYCSWDSSGVEMTADEYLAKEAKQQAANENDGAMGEAMAFLREQLAEGGQLSADVDQAAKHSGIAAAALRRARTSLGVKARKRTDGKWEIYLPEPGEGEGEHEGAHQLPLRILNALHAFPPSKA